MAIDTTKIENFDKMTDSEKVQALLNYKDEPNQDANTELTKLKNALNKASAEASEFKKQLREKQTEAERLEAERKEANDKLVAELNSLKRDKSVAEHISNFVSLGYNADLAKKSAEAVVDGDFNEFYGGLKTFLTEKEKSIKADVMKGTNPPAGGDPENFSTVTKEQFDAMGYAERVELFKKDPELYKKLKE